MNSFCTYSRNINILPTIIVHIQGQLVFTIDPLFIMPQRTEIIIPQAQCKSNIRVFCCRSKKLFTYMPRICFLMHCKYGYRRKKWILVFFPTQACLFDEPTSTRQRKMNAANCCFLLTTFSMSYSLKRKMSCNVNGFLLTPHKMQTPSFLPYIFLSLHVCYIGFLRV